MAQTNTEENIKIGLYERMIIEIFRHLKQKPQTEILQEMKKIERTNIRKQRIFYKALNNKERKIITYYRASTEFLKGCIFQKITSITNYKVIKKNFITKSKDIELYTLINEEIELLDCFNSLSQSYQNEILDQLEENIFYKIIDTETKCKIENIAAEEQRVLSEFKSSKDDFERGLKFQLAKDKYRSLAGDVCINYMAEKAIQGIL